METIALRVVEGEKRRTEEADVKERIIGDVGAVEGKSTRSFSRKAPPSPHLPLSRARACALLAIAPAH